MSCFNKINGKTKNNSGVQWLDTHLVCKNVSQTLLVMPVTDSFKKHEQNIFVDREDANVKRLKTRGNLSAKNKAKTSTLKSAYKHSKSKQIEEL